MHDGISNSMSTFWHLFTQALRFSPQFFLIPWNQSRARPRQQPAGRDASIARYPSFWLLTGDGKSPLAHPPIQCAMPLSCESRTARAQTAPQTPLHIGQSRTIAPPPHSAHFAECPPSAQFAPHVLQIAIILVSRKFCTKSHLDAIRTGASTAPIALGTIGAHPISNSSQLPA